MEIRNSVFFYNECYKKKTPTYKKKTRREAPSFFFSSFFISFRREAPEFFFYKFFIAFLEKSAAKRPILADFGEMSFFLVFFISFSGAKRRSFFFYKWQILKKNTARH